MIQLIFFLSLFLFMTVTDSEAAKVKKVTFASQGRELVGNLYLPDGYEQDQKLPGVVVTGAWTTVKEQMAGTYAKELANRGYAALAFDFRGWGESEDDIKYLEDPERKTEDINAAVNYLASRPEVNGSQIAGLGICASSGYMSDAALQNSNIQSLALVAPWLHNAEIVDAVYGGKQGVATLIQTGREAQNKYEASGEPTILEAASVTNENAVMFKAPYYTEADRGGIKEYDNKFNAASWEPWLSYDAIQTSDKLKKPTLIVHSESAAIPQGAKEYANRMGNRVEVIWLDNVTQFDFYDDPEAVKTSSDAVDNHFKKSLK